MKYLQPIKLKQNYYAEIEREIKRIFDLVIYDKLFALLPHGSKELKNSFDPVYDALLNGTIYYDGSSFSGTFNARITRALKELGAKFNAPSGTFYLPDAKMPSYLKMAVGQSQLNFQALQQTILRTLNGIHTDDISDVSEIPDTYYGVVGRMNTDWEKTVQSVSVAPKLTDSQKGRISSEWGYNLDLYIRDWTQENILELRKSIAQNTFNGRRPADLIKHIQDNYQVSRNKAKFLARQETSLLMSKFHETRYQDIGITKYRWSGAQDQKERKDHLELQGKIFTWSSPPVVDHRTGRRCNPGQDFNCRCVAIPILE